MTAGGPGKRRWRPALSGVIMVMLLVASSCARSGRVAAPPPAPTAGPTATAPSSTPATLDPTTTTRPRPAGPPYPVRQTVVTLVDRSRPTVSHGHVISPVRTLVTMVWYPVGAGRSPLVVFGHGFDVGPGTYTSLLSSWAGRGYVVAAPEFPLSDPAVAGANLDEGDIQNEPGDLRFVTDFLAAHPVLPVAVDPSRVGVAGHSDGAEAALAAATTPAPAGAPRYRAVIVMSGQAVPGAAGRNPPLLLTQGDADTINPMSLSLGVWDQAVPPRYFLLIRGGGHLPPLETGSPWLAGIEAVTGSFLDTWIGGTETTARFAASAAGFPNLSLRAG